MGKTSKVLFLHTFHVYQPGGEADWYTLDKVHLDRMFFDIACWRFSSMSFSNVLILSMYDAWGDGWNDLSMSIG
jgi:hypothetical protein